MVVVADAKIKAARDQGLAFLWRVELHDGRIYEQFDSDGTEYPLIDHNRGGRLMKKSRFDLYHGTPTIHNVKRGGWIPTVDGFKVVYFDVGSGSGLTIFRKTYRGTLGFTYYAYCLGVREELPNGPRENIVYICPPVRWRDTKGEKVFRGGASQSTDPLHKTKFDLFMDSQEPLPPPDSPVGRLIH